MTTLPGAVLLITPPCVALAGAPHATCASPPDLSGTRLLEATPVCFQSPPSSNPSAPSTSASPELASTQSSNSSRGRRAPHLTPLHACHLLTIRPPTPPRPHAYARAGQRVEVHRLRCRAGPDHLRADCLRHQRPVLVPALLQLPSSPTAPSGRG